MREKALSASKQAEVGAFAQKQMSEEIDVINKQIGECAERQTEKEERTAISSLFHRKRNLKHSIIWNSLCKRVTVV